MENREGTVIGIGSLAIACLYYFYKKYSSEAKRYKKTKLSMEDIYNKAKRNNFLIDYEAIRSNNQKTAVFFPLIGQYKLEQDTFKAFIRSQKITHYVPRDLESFRENQSGGRFTFLDRKNHMKLVAEINNCHIEEQALLQNLEKNIIFPENSHKISQTISISYMLKSAQKLAFYGVISYSLSEKQFIFEPSFILLSKGQSDAIMSKICDFWQKKIEKTTLWKITLAFLTIAAGYTLVYKPLRSIIERYYTKFDGINKDNLDKFLKKTEFSSRLNKKLICQECNQSNVAMIYQCGHLCLCQSCHAKNEKKICPICKKNSISWVKIFL